MRTDSMGRFLHLAVAAGLAAATLAAVAPVRAEAAAAPCERTFLNPDDLAITDDGAFTISKIDLPEDGLVVSDVDVHLDLRYPVPHELRIDAQNWHDSEPTIMATTRLYNGEQGVSGSDMLGTVFDDEADVPISWGDAPYTGRFMPTRPLADLDGVTGGQMVLLIAKVGGSGSTGTLDSWSITLRYTSCDFDSDGVEDHADKCLGVPADTVTGCPVAARTLSAKYGTGSFKGVLSSPVVGCRASRAVTVWKARVGPDRKVGTAVTRPDGSYGLVRERRPGRYYARSPRVLVPGVAECPAVTSASFRIG